MTKKRIALAVGAGVLAVLCGAGIYFAPQIRQAAAIARGAAMSDEEKAAQEEENRRLEQELREQLAMPEGEVSEEINAGVMDGSLSLEEAARQWLEQNGEMDLTTPGGAEGDAGTDEGTVTGGDGTASVSEAPVPDSSASDDKPDAAIKENEPDTTVKENKPDTTVKENKPDTTVKENKPEPAAETNQPEPEKEPEPDPEAAAKAEKEARIQNLVAQAQVLRSAFTAKLDSVVAECKAEFLALEPEQQTTSNKVRIVTSRLGEVADMEDSCDAQVASIVSQLQELDPDLAARVQDQYEREKMAKKTSLLNEYRNGS
ncbi:MAG: hypothetical protein IJT94_03810 [Oscillibacter sp.]|nr:hypothetical protein [Oscillibacter sp.]